MNPSGSVTTTGSEIEDSYVMVNIDNGKYVALNRTANAVWQALAEPRTQQQIEDTLRERFDVPHAVCHEAVSALLEKMRGLSLAAPQ